MATKGIKNMKNTPVILLLLIIVGFLFNSCSKCNPWGDCEPAYTFKVVDSLIRKNDTVALGDTIWLGTCISDSLLLDYEPRKVYFPNAKLTIGLSIYDYENDIYVEPEYVLVSGSFSQGGVTLNRKGIITLIK